MIKNVSKKEYFCRQISIFMSDICHLRNYLRGSASIIMCVHFEIQSKIWQP